MFEMHWIGIWTLCFYYWLSFSSTNCSFNSQLKIFLTFLLIWYITCLEQHLFAAFLWQLMRYNMLHLLRTIKYKGKEVSDTDILEWANNKVKASGRKSRMESFKVFLYCAFSLLPSVFNVYIMLMCACFQLTTINVMTVLSCVGPTISK